MAQMVGTIKPYKAKMTYLHSTPSVHIMEENDFFQCYTLFKIQSCLFNKLRFIFQSSAVRSLWHFTTPSNTFHINLFYNLSKYCCHRLACEVPQIYTSTSKFKG